MGRRRRKKVVKIVKRSLPKYFTCPRCGVNSVQVKKNEPMATVICSQCGLKGDVECNNFMQPVDIFCKFSDLFYTGALG